MQLNDMSDWTVYNVQVEGEGYKTSKNCINVWDRGLCNETLSKTS